MEAGQPPYSATGMEHGNTAPGMGNGPCSMQTGTASGRSMGAEEPLYEAGQRGDWSVSRGKATA